jgi:putative zinc finger/helix-turn-helix YgiT family protein
MKCLSCDGVKFQEKRVRFAPTVKDEQVDVVVPAFVCQTCDQPLMDSTQMNRLRKAGADEYKTRHGLLTSEQIVEFRKSFGMTQSQFAEYLGFGEASIKRWETYFVQEKAQDDHIRLKCDETYASSNAIEVRSKHQQPDIFNGNVKFSLERFQAAALYLLPATKSPLFLNKAMFYADFVHYKKHGRSLTGAKYIPLEYGPCPDQYQSLFERMKELNLISSVGRHNIEPKVQPDMTQFDDKEIETLKTIYQLAEKDGGQTLFDKSHEEEAFLQTKSYEPISYDFAKKLRLV